RFSTRWWWPALTTSEFPLRILLVNSAGCLAMGLVIGLMSGAWQPSDTTKFFLISGVLGGFTTFSAFSLEFAELVEKHWYGWAMTYAGLSFAMTIAAFFVGIRIAKLAFVI
ncbi:MAG: CrcB family protein, partial [Gammaproteobacteria bacterium]|nr:CrcB family protein [Gammaproteobacteria bacterium]